MLLKILTSVMLLKLSLIECNIFNLSTKKGTEMIHSGAIEDLHLKLNKCKGLQMVSVAILACIWYRFSFA